MKWKKVWGYGQAGAATGDGGNTIELCNGYGGVNCVIGRMVAREKG